MKQAWREEDILEKAIDAHGGVHLWSVLKSLSAKASIKGALAQVTGHAPALSDLTVSIEAQGLRTTLDSSPSENFFATLDKNKIAIRTPSESAISIKSDLKYSASGRWSEPQLAVFVTELLQTVLLTPLLIGAQRAEIGESSQVDEPEGIESALAVEFPLDVKSISKNHMFYFDQRGQLVRHDFEINYANGSRITRFPSAYQNFEGLAIPTVHEFFVRLPDGAVLPEPLALSIVIRELEPKFESLKEASK